MAKRKSLPEIKTQAGLVHDNKYDYQLLSGLPRSSDKVTILCPIHGPFNQRLNSHLMGRGCNKCAQITKEQTWMENYGVNNPGKSQKLKEKRNETCMLVYGTTVPMELQDIKNKVKHTKSELYGDENYNNIQQHNETCLSRYGSENVSSLDWVKEKKHKTSLDRYGTDHSVQRNIPADVLQLLNNKEWMIQQHHDNKYTLKHIAKLLSVDPNTIARYVDIHQIDKRLFAQSLPEREINKFITDLGITTEQSNRTIISPLELDIYMPDHKIAIEYCGLYWHADIHKRIDKSYHKRKHDKCKELGIQLITIFEDEWEYRNNQVKQKILSLLGKDNRTVVYARNCNIQVIQTKEKSKFFENNHIQGDGPCSLNIGLAYNDDIVAVMGFIKQKDKHYLNRYATSVRVPGGFSKLLAYFKANYDWSLLISFADLRWSDGNLYEKTGWELESTIPPDYSYSQDGKTRSHKFNYRRKHLPKLLEVFDPNLSERINCDNNGILRLWDCGKLKFIQHSTGDTT